MSNSKNKRETSTTNIVEFHSFSNYIRSLINNNTIYKVNDSIMITIRKIICENLLISDGCFYILINKKSRQYNISYTDIHLQLNQLMRMKNSFSGVAGELYNLRNIISHTKPLDCNSLFHLAQSLITYISQSGSDCETQKVVILVKNIIETLIINQISIKSEELLNNN